MVVTRRGFLSAAATLAASNHPALAAVRTGTQGPTAPGSTAGRGRCPFAGVRYDPHVYEAPPPFHGLQLDNAGQLPLFRIAVAASHPSEAVVPDVRAALGAFDQAFQWTVADGSLGGGEFDLWFAACGQDAVRVGLPAPPGRSGSHWVTVQVLGDAAHFALLAVLHTILATACVPGLIGVDFEDVHAAATLGTHGVLAVGAGDPERAISGAYGQLAADLNDREAGRGVLAMISALLLPKEAGSERGSVGEW